MAGQAHHHSADRTGPMDGRNDEPGMPADQPDPVEIQPASRRPSSRRRRPPTTRLVGIPIAPDEPAIPIAQPKPEPTPEAISPDYIPRQIRTRGTQRLLNALGLNREESTGLVAYMIGLPIGKQPWTLDQINKILFLRELYKSDWGTEEKRVDRS